MLDFLLDTKKRTVRLKDYSLLLLSDTMRMSRLISKTLLLKKIELFIMLPIAQNGNKTALDLRWISANSSEF